MKQLLALAIACLASCQAAPEPAPHIDLLYGIRDFDTNQEWEQTDKQEVAGLQVHFCGNDGFGPEIGLNLSQEETSDPQFVNRSTNSTTTTVRELYLGLRKNFMITDSWQAHLSGGWATFKVDTKVDLDYAQTYETTGHGNAPYLSAGTNYFVTDSLTAGLMYRHHFMSEDADIYCTNPDLDGGMFLVSLGWSF
jgi:hypothetical protein